ncbi:hypothetical protein BGZ72_002035, partial [Mortierella alpina]
CRLQRREAECRYRNEDAVLPQQHQKSVERRGPFLWQGSFVPRKVARDHNGENSPTSRCIQRTKRS